MTTPVTPAETRAALSRRGLLGLSAGAVLTAAGCSGSVTGNAGSNPSASAGGSGSAGGGGGGGGGTTNVTAWHQVTGTPVTTLQALVDEFNKQQTAYKVSLQFVAGTSDQFGPRLISAINNNQGPDMVFSDAEPPRLGAIIASNKVVQLDSLLATGSTPVVKSKIPPGMLASSTFDGKLYSLPTDGGDYGFFYNKKMFTAAGITTPPVTWDDVAAYSKKLTKGGQYGIYLPISSDEWTVWTWEAMLWSAGGEFLSDNNTKVAFDTPAGVLGLKTWTDLLEAKLAFPSSLSTTTGDSGREGFAAGKFAMFIDGAYDLSIADQGIGKANVGVCALPKLKTPAMNTGTDVSYILKTSAAAQKGSWEFLSWFMQGPQMSRWDVATGFLPCYNDVQQDAGFKAYVAKEPRLQTFIDELAYAKTRPSIASYTEISNAIGQQLEKAMLGKQTPQQAIDAAGAAARKILAA